MSAIVVNFTSVENEVADQRTGNEYNGYKGKTRPVFTQPLTKNYLDLVPGIYNFEVALHKGRQKAQDNDQRNQQKCPQLVGGIEP